MARAAPHLPAGTVQREGMLFKGVARRRGGKVVLWIFIGLLEAVVTNSLLVAFIAHHRCRTRHRRCGTGR